MVICALATRASASVAIEASVVVAISLTAGTLPHRGRHRMNSALGGAIPSGITLWSAACRQRLSRAPRGLIAPCPMSGTRVPHFRRDVFSRKVLAHDQAALRQRAVENRSFVENRSSNEEFSARLPRPPFSGSGFGVEQVGAAGRTGTPGVRDHGSDTPHEAGRARA